MSKPARVPATTVEWEWQRFARGKRNRLARELAAADARDLNDLIGKRPSPVELARSGQVLQAISGFRRKM